MTLTAAVQRADLCAGSSLPRVNTVTSTPFAASSRDICWILDEPGEFWGQNCGATISNRIRFSLRYATSTDSQCLLYEASHSSLLLDVAAGADLIDSTVLDQENSIAEFEG